MLGGEAGKIHGKNRVKFRTSAKEFLLCAIYWYIVRVWTSRLLVLSLLLCLSHVGMRHLLARVTTTLPLCLPGNSTFYALSSYINQAVMLDRSRGCEASTGWVWGLLSRHWCGQVEGEA